MAANVYECMFLLDTTKVAGDVPAADKQLRTLLEKNHAEVLVSRPWDERRLAYPILKKQEGVYHLLVFDASGETLDEITRQLKIDDAVMRHLAVKHIEGSSTRAPRDDTPVPAPAPREEARAYAAEPVEAAEAEADEADEAEQVAVPAAEYADTNTRSDEE